MAVRGTRISCSATSRSAAVVRYTGDSQSHLSRDKDAEQAIGWTEVTFVLSDDGPAQVLIAGPDANPEILDVIRAHA